ncbi:helix-turn-helix domain-containing protein [Mesorhizobium sp. WSM2239]|uniref:Helix-turn-helix domain-containing protein n=2 Tax=unclassified Mesorhizobium TaxID=325217 RepID=A0AAU8DHL5_9HYPH
MHFNGSSVKAAEFRVAYRLVQHANSEGGAIFPSQERLADQTGTKVRIVRA